MANINDYIQQIVGAAAGKVEIPDNLKEQVLGGLSSSVLGSLTQTASKAGGLDELKGFLTGKSDAATSEITALAGNLFNNNVLSKLNLGSLAPVLAGLVPGIMGKLSGFLKDQDGDGDVDLNDILASLKGNSGASGLLGAATSILGGLFGKKN
ncbi:MAG: hypothetical protein J5917_00680 [Bacteroidales bacterium]|nr:hypothetical protein [Bacteroidales bacterium]